VESSYIFPILGKELLIAASIGVIGGCIVGGIIYAVFPEGGNHGIAVGLSLFSAILTAALLGTLMPFWCLVFKVDPAYASGPVLTTMNDILGFLIFFGIAYLVIPV
jgi:magnesium transporter